MKEEEVMNKYEDIKYKKHKSVYQFIRGIYTRNPLPTKIDLVELIQKNSYHDANLKHEFSEWESGTLLYSWDTKDDGDNIIIDTLVEDIIELALENSKTDRWALLIYRNNEDNYCARKFFTKQGFIEHIIKSEQMSTKLSNDEMTYDQFMNIARKGGRVRWKYSNKVERLRITKKGILLALPIHYHRLNINPGDMISCTEVEKKKL